MSRIDEALRRAGVPTGPEREPETISEVATGDGNRSHLDRYAPEATEHPRGAAPHRQEPRTRPTVPAVTPKVAYRAQIASFDPSLQGKLVISRDVSVLSVEQYRRLAANLHERQLQSGLKSVMVSSAVPREGKTLTVTNLALTLSESYHRRVLLIDADLRRPSVHEVFGFPNRAGLADVAPRGVGELALVEVTPRLSVLPAGRLDSNAPTAELTSGWMQAAIADASSQFDWVLLDTPPVGLLPDAHLIASAVQGVVLVIAAGRTPYDLVRRAIAELGADRIIGTVLNRVQNHAFAGGAYYGSYYQNPDERTAGA